MRYISRFASRLLNGGVRRWPGHGRNLLVHLRRRFSEGTTPPGRQTAYVELHDTALRRYGYLFLNTLHLAGYNVILRLNPGFFGETEDYADLVYHIPGLRIALAPPFSTECCLFFSDRRDEADSPSHRRPWRKVIKLDIDAFQDEAKEPGAFHIPPPMHPLLYARGHYRRIPELRGRPRTMRVFFAGNVDPRDYSGFQSSLFGGVPRHELIDHVRRSASSVRLTDAGEADELPGREAGYQCGTFILRGKVDVDRWLETISLSDFFLAPPGIRMPFCHNIVEALAVGTVPILEHPDVLHPPLEHGRNCIAFEGKEDLIEQLQEVLERDEDDVRRMRQEAMRYYDEHLDPRSFARRLEGADRPVLDAFMIAGTASVARYDARAAGSASRGSTG